MYSTIMRLGLAVGPDIHIDFVSCEEMRKETQKEKVFIIWKQTVTKEHKWEYSDIIDHRHSASQ